MPETQLRRTHLYSSHVDLMGRMVPFAGWEMPVQYAGILEESRAVRSRCGMFDIGHMGRVVLRGAGAQDLLQRLTTNDVARLAPGSAHYSLLTNPQGGIVDDIIVYCRAESDYLVVINAGRGLNGSVMTSDTAQWEEMIRTNLLGAAKLIRQAGLRMLKSSEGKAGADLVRTGRDMVVLGSTVGRNVSPFSSMYGSTKFGVHGLVEGARRELGPKGIRVTLIAPGFVKSEFQGVAGYDPAWVQQTFDRIGPVLVPEDVARVVTFAASQPGQVHVNDVMLRPTRQDYP